MSSPADIKFVSIGSRLIGPGRPTYIIADVGSNHDGSLEKAKSLVSEVARQGVDAVKFQSFTPQGLIGRRRRDATGAWTPHPAWTTLERLAVPEDWHPVLVEHARACGVDFLSTPFEESRVDLLARLGVPAFKVASGDLTHFPLLRHVARQGRPIVLSTGLADLGEVGAALEVLHEAGARDVILLHCVSTYPSRFEEANVRAVQTLAQAFRTPVGISDHSPGDLVPLAAIALGACVVEKHVTTDRRLPGPDHPYALEMAEMGRMVQDVRNLERALGDGVKRPSPAEVPERIGARRALHARRPIPDGTSVDQDCIKIVRHADGIAPGFLEMIVGRPARCDIEEDEPITWKNV